MSNQTVYTILEMNAYSDRTPPYPLLVRSSAVANYGKTNKSSVGALTLSESSLQISDGRDVDG